MRGESWKEKVRKSQGDEIRSAEERQESTRYWRDKREIPGKQGMARENKSGKIPLCREEGTRGIKLIRREDEERGAEDRKAR